MNAGKFDAFRTEYHDLMKRVCCELGDVDGFIFHIMIREFTVAAINNMGPKMGIGEEGINAIAIPYRELVTRSMRDLGIEL